jgi:hypothetical protein
MRSPRMWHLNPRTPPPASGSHAAHPRLQRRLRTRIPTQARRADRAAGARRLPRQPGRSPSQRHPQPSASMDTAMSSGATHNMWVQRYDITDPAQPDTYLAKVWSPTNTPIYDHHQLLGVVHRVEEITDLDATLSVMAQAIDAGDAMSVTEQLHTMAAFSTALPADRQTPTGVGRRKRTTPTRTSHPRCHRPSQRHPEGALQHRRHRRVRPTDQTVPRLEHTSNRSRAYPQRTRPPTQHPSHDLMPQQPGD